MDVKRSGKIARKLRFSDPGDVLTAASASRLELLRDMFNRFPGFHCGCSL